MRKVLIVDEVHPSMTEGLTNLGFEVETRTNLSLEDFASILPTFDGLVVRSKFKITADLLENTSLSFIARAGAGLDLLDVDACIARGIAVFSANEGNSDAVAEHVIGQILSLAINYIPQIPRCATACGKERGIAVLSSKVKPLESSDTEIWVKHWPLDLQFSVCRF